MRISDWSSDVCSSDLRVPGERRDAVARCNPEDTKGLRSLTRTLIAAVPVIPPNRLHDSLRDDLPLAVRARCIFQYSADQQRRVLHQSPPHVASFFAPLRLPAHGSASRFRTPPSPSMIVLLIAQWPHPQAAHSF